MSSRPFAIEQPRRLPLVTLYVTERCNSRCVTCDYWRHGRLDISLHSVRRLLPSLDELGTRLVALSGGEPLLHRDWALIAELLRAHGFTVWLMTSGLSLAKHARRAAELFHAITVSLDGTDRDTYAAIRGVNAFDKVCEGARAAANHGVAPSLRVTLQRANYRQMPAFVEMAKALGARQVSFLAVDVANPHAFGRSHPAGAESALQRDDLPAFEQVLHSLERDHAADFHSGFIAESPAKLRRILQYFAAVNGTAAYPAVRCNAPEFSAVIGADGRVQPCFFIAAPPRDGPFAELAPFTELASALDSEEMTTLRADIQAGNRLECRTCVCSMWRDLRVPAAVPRTAAQVSP